MCPFAMVGFAEGLWSQMIGMLTIGTLIVAVLSVAALQLRSRWLALLAVLIDLVVAWAFWPWEAFSAPSQR